MFATTEYSTITKEKPKEQKTLHYFLTRGVVSARIFVLFGFYKEYIQFGLLSGAGFAAFARGLSPAAALILLAVFLTSMVVGPAVAPQAYGQPYPQNQNQPEPPNPQPTSESPYIVRHFTSRNGLSNYLKTL
jgi:hypothetical protein